MDAATCRPLPAVPRRGERGFALESTLIVLVLTTALLGAATVAAITVRRTSTIDYRAARVAHAADAGADAIMAQLEVAMNDGIIQQAELDALVAPTLPGFAFTELTTQRVGGAIPRTVTNGPYAGLISLNQQVDIGVTATDPIGDRRRILVSVNAQSLPLFQFGVFYEEDLEIHNGPDMTFAGWVHTNGNLYLTPGSGTGRTFFRDIITTPDSVFWQRKNTNYRTNNVFIADAAGTDVALQFDSRTYAGNASGFVSRSDQDFDGRLMTGASGVTPLRLPLPTGVPPIALIQPDLATDDAATRSVKFAWKARDGALQGWHVTVDAQTLGTPCAGTTLTHFRPAGFEVPDAAACALIFQGRVNAFHEGRENIGPDLLDIDLQQLATWAAGSPGTRWPGVLYVTFTNVDTLQSARDFPAVRLRNGPQLLRPVTIATDRPLYVQGNFNTGIWQPASLLGDAITFLSPGWNDATKAWNAAWSPQVTQSYGTPPAASGTMTVFAAIAAGHSATPCDWQRSGCTIPANPPAGTNTTAYGGGLENFPRFLENWSGVTMTYRGSLVSLFQSQHAARRRWSWRSYYSPPARDWAFDLRFRDPNQLPPGTPTVGSVVQTAYRPVWR